MTATTASRQRLSASEYVKLCVASFKQHWWQILTPILFVLVLQQFVRFEVNYTESLPDHVFVTVKGWTSGLKHGDYVTYEFPCENSVSLFKKGDHMVKIVGGVAGDRVVMNEARTFTVLRADASEAQNSLGGQLMGVAKTHSKTGKPVAPGPTGVIPEDHYYVFAPHPDSLDSRYAEVGFLPKAAIVGRTFPLL